MHTGIVGISDQAFQSRYKCDNSLSILPGILSEFTQEEPLKTFPAEEVYIVIKQLKSVESLAKAYGPKKSKNTTR